MNGNKVRTAAIVLVMLLAMGALAIVPGEAKAATPAWMEETTMPQGATAFAYCKLNDGRVFMTSGFNHTEFTTINNTYIYDPEDGNWMEMEPAPMAVYGASAVAMPDGKVYVFGGYELSSSEHLKQAMIYDLASDSWTMGSDSISDKLWNVASVALDETTILLAGGQDLDLNTVKNTCYIYDIEEDTFTATGSIPSARAGGAAVKTGSYVYYYGGWDASFTSSATLYYYYIDYGNWYYHSDLPSAIVGQRALWGEDGVVYTVGGSGSVDWSGSNTNKCTIFSMYDYSVTEIPELEVSVRYAGLVELDSGKLFMFGGNDGYTDNEKGYTLQIWSKEAWVDKTTVGTGESFRVYVNVQIFFQGLANMYCTAFLADDNIVYLSEDFFADGGLIASTIMTVPEDLEPGTYQLLLPTVNANTPIGGGNFEFEPFELTVTSAPTLQDRLDDLEQQNQALQDQLSTLSDDLNDTRAELADVKDSADAKLDAMIGYVILILALGALIVGMIILVRKK